MTGRDHGTPIAPSDAPLAALAVIVLRHWRLLLLVPLATFALTVLMVTRRQEYSAESKLSPQRQSAVASGLMGLAATFGVNLPQPQWTESLEFYAELLTSREVLDSVVLTTYRFDTVPGGPDSLTGNLIELYGIEAPTPELQLRQARGILAGGITATARRPSAIVTLRTTARWPGLAERVNRRLLDALNEFSTRRRMAQGGAERRFLEGRLAEARADLERARTVQSAFLARNRVWQSDPRLTLEMQRIEADVQARLSVTNALNDSYQRARLDEVHNTPVITVVDGPEGSGGREGGLGTSAFAALIIGGVLALALALLLEYAARERALHPEAYDTVRRLWKSLPLVGRIRV